MHDMWAGWELRCAAGLAVVLVCILTGCSAGQPMTSVPQSRRSGGPSPSLGSSVPTATASIECSVHAVPQGWASYQDARIPFRVAVPPHWRTGAFEFIPDGSGDDTSPSHTHIVDLFGPESDGLAASSGKMRFDTIGPVITIEIGYDAQELADGLAAGKFLTWHAQPAPVCVGVTGVTEYLFTNTEGDVEMVAVLANGPQGSLWTFEVASHASTATRDAEYFQVVLSTFNA